MSEPVVFDVVIMPAPRGYWLFARFTDPATRERHQVRYTATHAEVSQARFPLLRHIVETPLRQEVERVTGRPAERGTLTLPAGWWSVDGPETEAAG